MFKKYRLYGNFSGIRKKVLDLQMEDYSTYELLLNLSEVRVTSAKIEKNKIYISCFVKKSDTNCPCPNYGKESDKVNQKTLYRVRDLDIFDSFLKMLETKQNYVVNYVENYLSNAVTEGCNNLIRTIRRISFGMVNFQHLTWRVLAI